ncbi:hypothetical protein BC941DRAFT_468384 [Chlamydoabsidia padenii]|nr:hypothetical protein BC941DRAFT_468384 [Chlamydoabsidia padenii]
MKIKKTPSKKLAPLPPPLRDLVKHLEEDDEKDIPGLIEQLDKWTYSRGDLFHWVTVLNRFDIILQRICDEYKLDTIQSTAFDSATKRLLLSISNFSLILFEHCTNRNIYNSYDHLNSLLNTTDIDVLEAILRFLLRPAQRVTNPKAIRSSFVAPQDKVLELARGWSIPYQDLESLCSDQFTPNSEMLTIKLQFYRTLNNNNNHNDNDSIPDEGVQIVTEDLSQHEKKTDLEWFTLLVKQHQIPKEYHFELLNRIRIANNIGVASTRKQLIVTQLISLSIMAHTASESTAHNKVFVYEPHLVSHLADAINPAKPICYEIQTYALYALDAIARHRTKLNEVLHAFNASANHGTLLHILRQINSHPGSEGFPDDFLEALFTLLLFVLETQPGGQMLMTAGIIPTLLNIVDNQDSIHLKNVTKVIGLLDTIVATLTTSFSAFCNANGLDILLNRIKSEVTQGIEKATSQVSMEGVEATEQDPATGALAPYDRVSLVKIMVKFLYKMMESIGTADGLRNLIDSSAPSSIIMIIDNPKVFGNTVFALATNVTSLFIHNEPTSLAILQEQKLPQTFLKSISSYENPNGEVLGSAIHAFGAICLNGQGLQMFNEYKPLPHFFNLMTSPDILRNPTEVDHSTTLGNTMDELIRHHPSLRPDVFQCVTHMIKNVLEMGHQDLGKPSDNGHVLQLVKTDENIDVDMESAADKKSNEKVECLLVSYIDLVSRFLEGLFQNPSNIREFVKDRCPEMLLDYYTLPMLPVDFSTTIASDSLSYIFRLIAETSPIPTVLAIVEKVKSSMKFILEDTSTRNKSLIREYIDVKDNETDKIERGNKVLRQFVVMYGYVGLLANICCSPTLNHGKNGIALVNEFTSQTGEDNIILQLGQLNRVMAWENILLRESVPKPWYNFKTTKKTGNTRSDNPLGISGFDNTQPIDETTSATASGATSSNNTSTPSANDMDTNEEKEPDAKDPRVLNTKHFKMFLSDIPEALTPIFQGLNKVSVGRRSLENGQVKQSFKLAGLMAQTMKDNISWSCITDVGAPPCKYDYLASMFSFISVLILDDRATPSLYAPLAVTFDKNDGTKLLTDTLDKLWAAAESVEAIPIAERSTSDQEDLLPRIDASIELLLAVLLNISSIKLLMDSPYTTHFIKSKDRSAPDLFEPREWNISVTLRVAAIRKHLKSDHFYKFPKQVLRMYIKVLAQLMSNDFGKSKQGDTWASIGGGPGSSGIQFGLGGASGNNPGSSLSTPTPSPFNIIRTPTIPNEAGVQTLVDMGFNRTGAEQAMVRCNNQISRAVDYLFSHPSALLAGGSNSTRNRGGNTSTTDQPSSNSPAQNTTAQEQQTLEHQSTTESDAHHDSDNNGDNAEDDTHEDEDGDHDMEEEVDDFSDEDGMGVYDHDDDDGEDHDADSDMNDGDDDDHSRAFGFGLMASRYRSSGDGSSSNKGKNKAQPSEQEKEDLKALDEVRNNLRQELPEILLQLVDERDDVIFDAHSLLVVVCKGDDDKSSTLAKSVMSSLVKRVQESLNKDVLPYTKVCSELRLTALLLRDAPFHSVIPEIASDMTCLFDIIEKSKADLSDPSTPTPIWLASALLVLEMFICQSDEPKEVKLVNAAKKDDDDNDKGKGIDTGDNNGDTEMKNTEQGDKSATDNDGVVAITDHQREQLLLCCIGLLKKTKLSRDDLFAILRIIVRLTKNHADALRLVDNGGLELLSAKPRSSLFGFQGQQAFIILILRHVIEDKAVLEEQIDDIITTWGTIPRPRNLDITTYFRNNAAIALRDPAVFLQVSEKICRLTRYNGLETSRQIKIIGKDDTDGSTDGTTPAPTTSTSTHRSKIGKNSSIVINHLLNELLAVRSTDKEQNDLKFAYTGSILQCLVELVSSYPSCKYDIYNFSRQRVSSNKSGNNSTRPHQILDILINDLLPYNAIKPTDDESRKGAGLSMWTSCVLVAMCYNTLSKSEVRSYGKSDLTTVRRYVLEGVVRAFNSLTQSSDPLSVKYNKYLSLADLCHRILNARPNPGSQIHQQNKEDTSMQLAKIMLDKGFVGVMTSAISDVDVNYPHAKIVLSAMIRPLEQLTKLAVAIERKAAEQRASDEATSGNNSKSSKHKHTAASSSSHGTHHRADRNEDSHRSSNINNNTGGSNSNDNNNNGDSTRADSTSGARDHDDHQHESLLPTGDDDENEAPDLYRNSSLAMFDGSVMEEDEDDMYSSEEEEGDSFDEDEFDEDTGSDLSDMSEEEMEDDVDQEMEVVLHRHHYDTDMDEDEDDDHDHDDDSDNTGNDDGSSSNSESDDDEDGRELTWHLEDIDEDGGVLVGAEITIESEDEQHDRHHHQHRRFEDGNDHDLDTLDQSDFDDDEGSEGYLDDEQDAELNEGLFVDESDLGDPFLVDDGPQGIQLADYDDDGNWAERPRGFGGLGLRRPGRSTQNRRLVEGMEILGGHPSRDRMPIVEFGGTQSSLGRPFRGAGGGSTSEDITTHPLLADNEASESTGPIVNNHTLDGVPRRPRGTTGFGNPQSIEDMIGGNGMRVLENILSRSTHNGRGIEGSHRMEILGNGIIRTLEMSRVPGIGSSSSPTSFTMPRSSGGQGSNNDTSAGTSGDTPADQSRQILTLLHEFLPMSTSERWNQEARMMYGTTMPDQAVKLTNALLNTLIPIALDEYKKRQEQEKKAMEERRQMAEADRRKKDEELKRQREEKEAADRKAEEERLAEEQRQQQEQAAIDEQQQEHQESSTSGEGTGEATTAAGSSETAASSTATDNEERTTITINGESVDISGTGIDVEFLEALPDDLREEVVNQHMRDRRESIQPPEDDSISPEFLEALPPHIRDEVLRQEAIERDRRDRQRRNASNTTTTGTPGQTDTPDATSATVDTEAAATTTTTNTTDMSPTSGMRPFFDDGNLSALSAIVRGMDDFVPTIDTLRDQPFSRMLSRYRQSMFTPTRGGQQDQNSHNHKKVVGRSDTMQLVDRTQLATLARLLFVPQSISKSLLNKLLLNLCENSKTRGDLLSLLICILHDGSVDLAAVDKSFAQLSLYPKSSTTVSNVPSSSTSSTKQQHRLSSTPMASSSTTTIGDNVPNLITQRCLEVLHYVVSCNEQSMTYFLTENDCLAGLKRSSSKKGKSKDTTKPSSKYPLLVLISLLDRPVFVNNTSLMEQLMNLLSTMCRPFPALVKKYVEKVETHHHQQQQQQQQTGSDGSTTTATTAAATSTEESIQSEPSSTATTANQSQHHRSVPKPPTIPDNYLKMVVHVLTSGECSSRTFQYTLGVISHLAALDGALQTITHEFTEAAKFSGKQILGDLQELYKVLKDAMTGTDIQASALTQFSAASSHQAKLLRVLKTIDYMYSRKRPTVATIPSNDGDSKESEQVKNEKRMLAIYDKLNFLPLWKMLGNCLAVIHEKEELINVATVLLPLIECFMVVSKYAESMTNQQLQVTSGDGKSSRTVSSSPEPVSKADGGNETPDDVFFKFTEDHKKILNIMVRNNPTLMSGSFSLLVRNPKMLEFDNKRNYFVQQLHKRTEPRSHYPPLQLNVRRQYVFEDSYHQLQGRTGEEIKFGKLTVRFYDEAGVDAGGVGREWFSVLARQMFDPNYALFIASAADKLTYQPNRASWVNPDHLSFFKFVGRVIGKAIYDGRLLDAYFTRSFYKHILNRSVDYRDVEAVDPEYYKSLVWMLDNDITNVFDLTFSMEMDDFGTTKVIDLKPGGRDLPVTEQNKHEYVNLVTAQKLTIAIKDQINAFLQGFHDVIPASLIQIFNEQELELLISGLPDIDLDDWKNNTEYVNYTNSAMQIQWFWRAVRSFDQEERAKLLQFATGTSKVPLEGFAHLQGSGGVQKFQIVKDYNSSRLPSAHTCFNQIDLPCYQNYETLRANLVKAINECSTGFALA